MVYLKSEYLLDAERFNDKRKFDIGSWDRLTPLVPPSSYIPSTIGLSNESKTHTGSSINRNTAHKSVEEPESCDLEVQGGDSELQEESDDYMGPEDGTPSTGMGEGESGNTLDQDIQLIEVTYT